MPFRSKRQAEYFFEHRKELEAQGVDLHEWAKDTDWENLPDRITPPKKKSKTPRLRKSQ